MSVTSTVTGHVQIVEIICRNDTVIKYDQSFLFAYEYSRM